MSKNRRFSPAHHIPHYSFLIFKCLRTPILVYIAITGNIITFGFSGLFWWVENQVNPGVTSYFDALWWGFCTVSTVGFGDVVPYTTTGRVLGMFLMVIGVVFFVSFTALLVAIITPMAVQEQLESGAETKRD